MNKSVEKPSKPPEWDFAFAEKLEGSTVLVEINYHDPEGQRIEQFFGTVMSANPMEGIAVRLDGSRSGEMFTLPPDQRTFIPAPPGEYRLRETGEIVTDPDYTSTWDVMRRRN